MRTQHMQLPTQLPSTQLPPTPLPHTPKTLRQSAARAACFAGAVLCAMAGFTSLTGCAEFYYGDAAHSGQSGQGSSSASTASAANLMDANYRAVDALLGQTNLEPQSPVLVGTVVQIDRVGESSRLGRLFTEQLSTRLTQRGVRVSELKLRENLLMHKEQGELLLSREAREVSQTHRAQAVLVGTYATSMATLYVSLKLVQPTDNIVLAAYDYVLPMDGNVRSLLEGR